MKFIYIILMFMVFVNIFTFMFAYLDIIPYQILVGDQYYELNDVTNMRGEDVFFQISNYNFSDVTGTLNLISSVLSGNLDFLGIVAAGIGASIFLHSASPLAVSIFLGVFVNTFRRSSSVFYGFQANEYLIVAAMAGVIFMFVITMIEYFTQGDT